MNNGQTVKVGGTLERQAVRLLRDVPGVLVEPSAQTNGRADAVVQVGGVTKAIELKSQPITNAATARQLIEYAQGLPDPKRLVVVTRTITAEAKRRLMEAGVGFLDATGAKYLDLPGLYLWTEGSSRAGQAIAAKDTPGLRLSGRAGVATQAMLNDPERRWRVRDLAEQANASLGLIHRLFVRLEGEGLVDAEGAGPHKTRRVAHPGGLLDLWAEEVRDRGVRERRAYRLSRDPRARVSALSRALDDAGIDHAVTGAAAAARLAPFVTSVPVTEVWVSELIDLADAVQAVSAGPVTEGHNVVLRSARNDAPLMFRVRHDDAWLADTFRIYVDLRADPRRGREQAARLREEVIGF